MTKRGPNPLSSLYYMGLQIDRYMTDAQALPVPVVSVGNISSGGRGKTPFVIEICKYLKHEGFSPVVLTRGYGRRSKKLLELDLSLSTRDWDAKLVGDEALEIAFFADVPVLIGPRRYENARNYLERHSFPKGLVFVLDDGFQHWKIKRDFDLVLVAPQDYHDRLLPLGRLREPVTSLARAHLVFEDGKNFQKKSLVAEAKRAEGKVYFLSTRVPSAQYKDELKKIFPHVLGLVLPDHASEERIRAAVERANPDTLLVGAKEAVKMFQYEEFQELVSEGSLKFRYAGKDRHFIFVRCQLELFNPSELWSLLNSMLLRSSKRSAN